MRFLGVLINCAPGARLNFQERLRIVPHIHSPNLSREECPLMAQGRHLCRW